MDVQEVQRIKTEGRRVNPVRNVERLWLEVGTLSVNGCQVESRRVAPSRFVDGKHEAVPTKIEVYADRLGPVLERTRTEAHRMIWQRACEAASILRDEWIREHRKQVEAKRSPEDREHFINMNCNHHPSHELIRLGYRTGLPPLEFCRVVNPQTGTTMDAFEFAKLSADKRREWLVDAPVTPQNAAQRANEHLADTIARALDRSNQDRNPKR